MLELVSSPDAWVSLFILTVLEIVLGIDNIVFISILSGRLPRAQQLPARRIGLLAALVTRILLLALVAFLAHLETVLFTFVQPWTARDLVLFAGGVFLLYKATHEIYENVEHPDEDVADAARTKTRGFTSVIIQIMLLDIVFSLDSVITAVAMAEHVPIMVVAILIAVGIMLVFAGPVGDFVADNPSVRILALAFLVLIGATLIMDATGTHVPKGYLYAAIGFSLAVQALNLRRDRKAAAPHP